MEQRMNRRKFLKALFSIPLLAVVPKMTVEEKKWTFNVPKYNEATKEIIHPEGFIWPTGGPDFKWSHDKFFHPNDGLCELLREVDRDATYDLINGTDNPECKFEGLRDYLTTGKEQLQQLDDYSKTPFMDIEKRDDDGVSNICVWVDYLKGTYVSYDNGVTWQDAITLQKPTA